MPNTSVHLQAVPFVPQNERGLILVADDSELNRSLAVEMILPLGYDIVSAKDGREAIEMVTKHSPDVILLDVMMPYMNGFEVCRHLKSQPDTKNIPILVMTALDEVDDYVRAIESGADEFMSKPLNMPILHVRLKRFMHEKHLRDEISIYQKQLENKVIEQTERIQEVQDVTIFSMAKLAEYRDPETGEHIERIRHYANVIAQDLARRNVFGDIIDTDFIQSLFRSSILHDIGKVGIKDSILLKPGKLDPEEFEIMKQHARIGGDALDSACHRVSKEPFLLMAKDIAYSHHERYDGTGYPKKLAGENIPLAARIVSVADVFDALISRRPYKEPMPVEKAVRLIEEGRGTQFDPEVTDSFFNCLNQAVEISEKYKDKESVAPPCI